jgi:hypothetical protein
VDGHAQSRVDLDGPAAEAFAWLAHAVARLLDALTLATGAAAAALLLRLRRHLLRATAPAPIPVEPITGRV